MRYTVHNLAIGLSVVVPTVICLGIVFVVPEEQKE